jgi:hypothetical protein
MQVIFFMDAALTSLNCRLRRTIYHGWTVADSRRPAEGVMTTKNPDPEVAKKAEAEKRRLDEELDEALQDTFPASDPVKLVQPDPHAEPRDGK